MLTVRKNGMRLASEPLRKSIATIGRSPVCDIVVRSKGVKPVHYLVEWFGAGAPGGDDGKWSIVEIHSQLRTHDVSVDALGFGYGKILGDKPQTIGDFEFSWEVDRLHPADVAGAFTESLLEHSASIGYSDLIEILEVDMNQESVRRVKHIPEFKGKRTYSVLNGDVKLTFKWVRGIPNARGTLLIRSKDLHQVIKIGGKLNQMGSGEIHIASNDVLCITCRSFQYYIRFVAAMELPQIKKSALHSNLYRIGGAFAAGVLVLLFLFTVIYQYEPPVTDKRYTRIAKIEVTEDLDLSEPTEKAPVLDEEPIEPENADQGVKTVKVEPPQVDLVKPVEVVDSSANDSTRVESLQNSNSPPSVNPAPQEPIVAAPDPASNVNAPVSDINSLGLLTALKATPAVSSSNLSTSALSDIPATESAFNEGGVPISRNRNVGLLGVDSKLERADLSQATSDIKGQTQFLSKSTGSVSRRQGLSTGGGGANNSFGSKGGFASANSGSLATRGGLSKQVVRSTVDKVQPQIKTCYETALITKPDLQGKMTVGWTISTQGNVVTSKVVSTEFKSQQFESCLLAVIDRLSFPKSAKATEVVYPFIFR